jgi:hypothetical protein
MFYGQQEKVNGCYHNVLKYEGLGYNCVQDSRTIHSFVFVKKNKKKHSKLA